MKCYLENITSCLGFGSAESQSLAQSFLRSCSFSLRSLCLDSITRAAPHGKARWERLRQPRGCPGDEHCSERQTWEKRPNRHRSTRLGNQHVFQSIWKFCSQHCPLTV